MIYSPIISLHQAVIFQNWHQNTTAFFLDLLAIMVEN